MPSAIQGINDVTTPGPSSDKPRGSNKLGKDEFLKLLVTQLSHQDPLSPVDNQAFIAQLAQFSTVEQMEQTNSTLEALLISNASQNQTGVASLVGKDITYKSNSLAFDGTKPVPVMAELGAAASEVNATITDSKGKVVRTIKALDAAKGHLSIEWDGRDDSGTMLPAGDYKVSFTAKDTDGKTVDVSAMGRATAAGVSYVSGVPELILNGVRVRLADVVEVREPTTPTTPSTTASP